MRKCSIFFTNLTSPIPLSPSWGRGKENTLSVLFGFTRQSVLITKRCGAAAAFQIPAPPSTLLRPAAGGGVGRAAQVQPGPCAFLWLLRALQTSTGKADLSGNSVFQRGRAWQPHSYSHQECRPLPLLNPPELRGPTSSSALGSPLPLAITETVAGPGRHSSVTSWEFWTPSATLRNQIPARGRLCPGLYMANRADIPLPQNPYI